MGLGNFFFFFFFFLKYTNLKMLGPGLAKTFDKSISLSLGVEVDRPVFAGDGSFSRFKGLEYKNTIVYFPGSGINVDHERNPSEPKLHYKTYISLYLQGAGCYKLSLKLRHQDLVSNSMHAKYAVIHLCISKPHLRPWILLYHEINSDLCLHFGA